MHCHSIICNLPPSHPPSKGNGGDFDFSCLFGLSRFLIMEAIHIFSIWHKHVYMEMVSICILISILKWFGTIWWPLYKPITLNLVLFLHGFLFLYSNISLRVTSSKFVSTRPVPQVLVPALTAGRTTEEKNLHIFLAIPGPPPWLQMTGAWKTVSLSDNSDSYTTCATPNIMDQIQNSIHPIQQTSDIISKQISPKAVQMKLILEKKSQTLSGYSCLTQSTHISGLFVFTKRKRK